MREDEASTVLEQGKPIKFLARVELNVLLKFHEEDKPTGGKLIEKSTRLKEIFESGRVAPTLKELTGEVDPA